MREIYRALLQDESGQDLIEYALIAALVALGTVATLKNSGIGLANWFTFIATSFSQHF